MNSVYSPAVSTTTLSKTTNASGLPPRLRTFWPPEQAPQLVMPALPSRFLESSASRMNTRSAGRSRICSCRLTWMGRPSSWNDARIGIETELMSWPGGEVMVQAASSVWPSRMVFAVAGAPSTVQPAGTTGASWTWSTASSTSSRSFADTRIDCCPGPTHCRPDGSTVIVVFGTYDAGGSGPTAIRSMPGPRIALLNSLTVLAPAFSGTASAVGDGTSGRSAGIATSTAGAPLTLTDSEVLAAAVVLTSSRYVPACATVTSEYVSAWPSPRPSPVTCSEPEHARHRSSRTSRFRSLRSDSASSGINVPNANGYVNATLTSSICSWLRNRGACGPAQVLSTSSLMKRVNWNPMSMTCTPRALRIA